MKVQVHALYPISGNPPSRGHGDIMARAAGIFPRLTWALAVNPEKRYLFSSEERLEMMGEYVRHYGLENVTIARYQGATARFAQQIEASIILKGLRHADDLPAEMTQAMGNKGIAPDIETMVLFTAPAYTMISSSLIRELALLGENLEPYVLPPIAQRIQTLLQVRDASEH